MKKFMNQTHIEGWLYEHKLEEKVSGENSKNPGTPFITGTISIATDSQCTNVVQIHYTYTTAVTSTGKPNATFNALKAIIDGKTKTVMADGIDSAAKIRVDSALDLNEWYNNDDTLVSVKRNEGGFIHPTSELNSDERSRATFDTDIIITGTTFVEANEERGTTDKLIVKGAIFNFRNELLPVEYTVLNPNAIKYFESLEASPKSPIVTRVNGQQISQTVSRTVEETSPWGEVTVKEVRSSNRDFVITGAAGEPMVWDDESSILASELTEAMAAREIKLAGVKQRAEEYKSRSATVSVKSDNDFNF